jgi:hypothetical protein
MSELVSVSDATKVEVLVKRIISPHMLIAGLSPLLSNWPNVPSVEIEILDIGSGSSVSHSTACNKLAGIAVMIRKNNNSQTFLISFPPKIAIFSNID